jgi:hypothetical protein
LFRCRLCYVSIAEYFDENDIKPGDLDTLIHQIRGGYEIRKEFGDGEMGSQALIDIFSLFLLGDDEMTRKVQETTPDGTNKLICADGFRVILPNQFGVSFTFSLQIIVFIYQHFLKNPLTSSWFLM